MSRERYGQLWRDDVSEATVARYLYRHPEKDVENHGKFFHLSNAIKLTLPEKMADGKRGFLWNEWAEKIVKAWCDSDWLTICGCGASTKSTTMAAIVLTHWFSAPDETSVVVCTNTADMLAVKVWGEIERLYRLLGDQAIGRLYTGRDSILLGDENSKNGIMGFAVQKSAPIGIHNTYNVLVVDEMQDEVLRETVESTINLTPGKEFKFAGMGNPSSHFDPLGTYSEPSGGWKAISIESDSWKSKFGICLHLDGEKSPAIKEPDRYYFMFKDRDIKDAQRKWGRESAKYQQYVRGFFPDEGMVNTMFSESFLRKFQCLGVTDWKFISGTYLAVDPSFSIGGDSCIAYPFDVGENMASELCIGFREPIEIHLDQSGGEPLVYYLSRNIIAHAKKMQIPASALSLDCSGTQGTLADVIEREWEKGIFRVQFQGIPVKIAVSTEDDRTADKVYRNRVTQLYRYLWEYCHAGQVRGLAVETVKQLCGRQWADKGGRLEELEPKKIFKGRYGRSPDHADASVIAAAYVREVLGIIPGGEFGMHHDGEVSQEMKDMDLENSDSLFLQSDVS